MDTSIQNILMTLPGNKLRIVICLRDIIMAASEDISETVKWGRITFCYNAKPIAFLCVNNKKEGVELGFFRKINLEGFGIAGNNTKRIQFKDAESISARKILQIIMACYWP